MYWSPAAHRGCVGGDLDAGGGGGGGRWSKTPKGGEGPKVYRIFYLKRFVEAFDYYITVDLFALKTWKKIKQRS